MARAGLALLLTAGCELAYDPCFDPPSVVHGARVLAVRADPPESSGDSATFRIRALVAEAGGVAIPAQIEARVCVPNPTNQCPSDVPLAAAASVDSDHLTIDLSVGPELVAAARDADPLKGYGGTRVLADLTIALPAATLRASKLLLFAADGAVPNGPVDIDALEVGGPGRTLTAYHEDDMLFTKVPDGSVPAVFRPGTFELRPILRPGSVETYDVVDLSGVPVQLREQVSYEFYANAHLFYGDPRVKEFSGGFSDWSQLEGGDLADEPPPDVPPPAHGLVRLHALALQHAGRLWVVARDGRGGVDWISLRVDVRDERCCCDQLERSESYCCKYQPGLPRDRTGCPDLIEPLCTPAPKFALL